MITNFGINRFKSIEHFNERLTPLNVFVGTNNSGKSSVLQALHFAVSLAQSRRFLPDQQDAKESSPFTLATQQILYTPLQDVMYLGRGGVLAQSPNKEIQIQIKLDTNYEGQIAIRRGKNRNIAVTAKGAQVVTLLEDVSRPFSVYVPGLAGIAKTESFVSMGMLLRSVARGDANLVLRNVLYALHQSDAKWATFSAAFDRVFPGVTIEISFDQNRDEFIEAWVVKNGERLPLDGAGTGLLQTAQILSYIYLFEPATTLLDEPDSHLHPSNQRSLSELLIDLSDAGTTQFLIATHSRHILDTLKESANIIWMRQGQVEKSTVHLDLLIDLGALDKAEGLITQGIKYVVLTEDEDTKLIKALLSFLDLKTVQVWSYKGCSNILTAEAVANFVKSVSPGTKVVVHRDSDYLSSADKARISAPFVRVKVKNFFTSGIDLESYFCDVDHLKSLNVGYESQVEDALNSALIAAEGAMQEKAREGIKKVEHHRTLDGAPTIGKVVAKAWADGIDVKSPRWRHGKILLKEIRKQFLAITGKDIIVTTYSTMLKIDDLKKLFN